VILLDTNAVIWLLLGHPRAAPLPIGRRRLALSPVTLLELELLREVGRLELAPGAGISSIASDARWRLDNPTSRALFDAALPVRWTRDPFDRLLVAHVQLRRWKLATGDRRLQERLGADAALAL
jgi:PIN domain nuclease of toxin-antitoxin system